MYKRNQHSAFYKEGNNFTLTIDNGVSQNNYAKQTFYKLLNHSEPNMDTTTCPNYLLRSLGKICENAC